jgi:hypothetical protein
MYQQQVSRKPWYNLRLMTYPLPYTQVKEQ